MNDIYDITFKMFKNIIKNLNATIIAAVLSIAALGLTSYLVSVPVDYNKEDMSIVREYVVNSRTLKIHKVGCSAVFIMSNKNKRKINDSIINLTSKGYIICNKCKAGIKRKNELAANVLNAIDNILFGEEPITLPSKEEYLRAIDEMGNWYVDNIATYQTVYSDKASSIATNNYAKVKNKIRKVGNIFCYPCQYIEDSEGGYDMAGDDCVRFMMTCFNNIDKNFVKVLSKYSKMKWSSINSKRIATESKNIQYAMQMLGFEIYDTEHTNIDLNNDGYYEGIINMIDNSFKLQKGDILARDGHVHFFLNDNQNFGWGKVNNVYPQNSLTYVDYSNNTIICNDEIFTRVYRYVGNDNE